MSRQPAPVRTRRNFVIFCFFLAAIMGTAQWIGSGWADGLTGFAIVFGYGLLVSFVRHPALELLGPNGWATGQPDERQSTLGLEAVAFSGMVMGVVALAGGTVELAQGEMGKFGAMCAVGGFAFISASLILPRLPR